MAGDIPNGMLCYTGLTPGSTANVTCDEGYRSSSVLEYRSVEWNSAMSKIKSFFFSERILATNCGHISCNAYMLCYLRFSCCNSNPKMYEKTFDNCSLMSN